MKIVSGGNKVVRGLEIEEALSIISSSITFSDGVLSNPTLTLLVDSWYNARLGGVFDHKDYSINILIPLQQEAISSYTVENLNPELSVFNKEINYLTALDTGRVQLVVSTEYSKTNIFLDVVKKIAVGQGETYNFAGTFANGSLRKHVDVDAKNRLLGKVGDNPFGAISYDNPTGDINKQRTTQHLNWEQIYYNPNGYTLPPEQYNQWLYYQSDRCNFFTRNKPANTGTGHILNDIDLTGINANYAYTNEEILAIYPTWNPSSGMGSCATVISPRHVFGAAHWRPFVGMVVKFVDNNNNVITRTIVAEQTDYDTDHWVALLNQDLPPSITPFKVLPQDWLNYFPLVDTSKTARIVTFMCLSSYGVLQAGEYYEDSKNYGYLSAYYPTIALDAVYSVIGSWQWNGLFGSGSPVFMLVNKEPVLLFCLWKAGYIGKTIHAVQSNINKMMTTLSVNAGLTSNYQLTIVSLTGNTAPKENFNTY